MTGFKGRLDEGNGMPWNDRLKFTMQNDARCPPPTAVVQFLVTPLISV